MCYWTGCFSKDLRGSPHTVMMLACSIPLPVLHYVTSFILFRFPPRTRISRLSFAMLAQVLRPGSCEFQAGSLATSSHIVSVRGNVDKLNDIDNYYVLMGCFGETSGMFSPFYPIAVGGSFGSPSPQKHSVCGLVTSTLGFFSVCHP